MLMSYQENKVAERFAHRICANVGQGLPKPIRWSLVSIYNYSGEVRCVQLKI